jgi:hypothetical protein
VEGSWVWHIFGLEVNCWHKCAYILWCWHKCAIHFGENVPLISLVFCSDSIFGTNVPNRVACKHKCANTLLVLAHLCHFGSRWCPSIPCGNIEHSWTISHGLHSGCGCFGLVVCPSHTHRTEFVVPPCRALWHAHPPRTLTKTAIVLSSVLAAVYMW